MSGPRQARRVLVTGGAGFIGTNLVARLLAASLEVTIYDNFCRGQRSYLDPEAGLIEADIRDTAAMTAAMSGFDTVVHLAAFGSVVDSVADPVTNFDINVQGTASVLEAARVARPERMIFASTGGALIGEAEPPVDENSLPRPISPYGASKLCGEAYCHAYARAYDVPAVALRFANVYGPYSGHKKGAVTKFIKCLFRDEPFPIFGDGTSTRDYLHVDDLCSGITTAMTADIAGGEVFHLASGNGIAVADLARLLARLDGRPDHALEFHPPRPGEVSRNFATYDKARAVLGFRPDYELERGLAETLDWYRDNREAVLAMVETDS